MIKRNLYL